MRIAVISDTHIPSRADAIPEWVIEEVERSDHTIHAGDFDSPDAYERVVEIAPELTAVIGNMDPRNIDVPEVATLDVRETSAPSPAARQNAERSEDTAGVRFVVVHGTGDLATYDERVAGIVDEHAAEEGTTVGISGHTHQRRDEVIDGYRLLNPGSATGADPASEVSMLVVEVSDGKIDVTPVTD
jgi:hypothetical protein